MLMTAFGCLTSIYRVFCTACLFDYNVTSGVKPKGEQPPPNRWKLIICLQNCYDGVAAMCEKLPTLLAEILVGSGVHRHGRVEQFLQINRGTFRAGPRQRLRYWSKHRVLSLLAGILQSHAFQDLLY